MVQQLTSLHGRQVGITPDGAIAGNEIYMTNPCVDASISVSAEVGNARQLTVQLKDAKGNDVTERTRVQVDIMADANGDAFVTTGGSTGLGIGTDGALLATVAKKSFIVYSEADGDIDLVWTDTGTEVAYAHLILPNGRRVVSAALTNA